MLRQQPGRSTVTAIKRHERRDTLVVRLYNPFSGPIQETLRTDMTIAGAWLTDLLEEREAELPARPHRVDLAIEPHRIVTVELEIESP